MRRFRADFSTGDFSQWSWWGEGDPGYASIEVVRALAVGIDPPPGGGEYVGAMLITDDDARAGHKHAKLYAACNEAGRAPADVSGVYRCWYWIPETYELPSGSDAVNVLQWKERSDGSSDPLWWVNLSGARWALGQDNQSWVGGRPSGSDDRPIAFLNWWGNDWRRTLRLMEVPRGRWFEIRAELDDGDRIDVYIDDVLFDTALHAEYPVGPFQESNEEWIWGAGNYGGPDAGESVIYLGPASYLPHGAATGAAAIPGVAAEPGAYAVSRTMTINIPAGTAAGDALILAAMVWELDVTRSPPDLSGWTRLMARFATPNVGTLLLYARRHDGEARSVTLTLASSTDRSGLLIRVPGALDPPVAAIEHNSLDGGAAADEFLAPGVDVPRGGVVLYLATNAYEGDLVPPADLAPIAWARGDPWILAAGARFDRGGVTGPLAARWPEGRGPYLAATVELSMPAVGPAVRVMVAGELVDATMWTLAGGELVPIGAAHG